MIEIIIVLFIALSVFFISLYLFDNLKGLTLENRVNASLVNKKISFLKPMLFRLADKIGTKLSKVKNAKFQNFLEKSGQILQLLGGDFEKINIYQFFILRIFASLTAILICLFIISTDFILVLIAACGAFYLPLLYIKETFKKRKEMIYRQLPDFADLLSVMLESGADFFSAADKISKLLKGPLSDEFGSALSKISLGCDKKTALIEISNKYQLEPLSAFFRTVNMALDAGVGMSETLKRLAYQTRNERALYAEKKAQEAPVKILIPLVLFIFPTIFIVIFGPIAISFSINGGF